VSAPSRLDALMQVYVDACLQDDPRGRRVITEELVAWLGVAAVGRDERGVWVQSEIAGIAHRLRYVPPGEFAYGAPKQEWGRFPDEPLPVLQWVREGVFVAETTVTERIAKALGFRGPRASVSERPVTGIDWYSAVALCLKMTAVGRGLAFALPTQVLWEYACRAGTAGARWGEGSVPLQRMAWCIDALRPEVGEPRPVGQLEPNPWGLHDVLGNVWEWCGDEVPGPGEPSTGRSFRVCRGGSSTSYPRMVRAASRMRRPPGYRSNTTGFRVVARPASPVG